MGYVTVDLQDRIRTEETPNELRSQTQGFSFQFKSSADVCEDLSTGHSIEVHCRRPNGRMTLGNCYDYTQFPIYLFLYFSVFCIPVLWVQHEMTQK